MYNVSEIFFYLLFRKLICYCK